MKNKVYLLMLCALLAGCGNSEVDNTSSNTGTQNNQSTNVSSEVQTETKVEQQVQGNKKLDYPTKLFDKSLKEFMSVYGIKEATVSTASWADVSNANYDVTLDGFLIHHLNEAMKNTPIDLDKGYVKPYSFSAVRINLDGISTELLLLNETGSLCSYNDAKVVAAVYFGVEEMAGSITEDIKSFANNYYDDKDNILAGVDSDGFVYTFYEDTNSFLCGKAYEGILYKTGDMWKDKEKFLIEHTIVRAEDSEINNYGSKDNEPFKVAFGNNKYTVNLGEKDSDYRIQIDEYHPIVGDDGYYYPEFMGVYDTYTYGSDGIQLDDGLHLMDEDTFIENSKNFEEVYKNIYSDENISLYIRDSSDSFYRGYCFNKKLGLCFTLKCIIYAEDNMPEESFIEWVKELNDEANKYIIPIQ